MPWPIPHHRPTAARSCYIRPLAAALYHLLPPGFEWRPTKIPQDRIRTAALMPIRAQTARSHLDYVHLQRHAHGRGSRMTLGRAPEDAMESPAIRSVLPLAPWPHPLTRESDTRTRLGEESDSTQTDVTTTRITILLTLNILGISLTEFRDKLLACTGENCTILRSPEVYVPIACSLQADTEYDTTP